MLAELRALDPRPALGFEGPPVQPLVPDILMRPGRGGGWQLELNPDSLPRVLVNQRYAREVGAAAGGDKQARRFLNDRLQSANWLVRALEQRANTILRVAEAIVSHQAAFFQHGVEHLRPLTLREVAETIEMHESTVSRVTANKYIASPRGTFELKYFFTATIQGADGGSHAAEAVRQRIKTLIDQETPDTVLSDDRIVAILRAEGVDIARRTVAKYRDAMGIPSSTQRRREKAAIA
jgi:RNA polymerase sigma-54 factor